MFMNTIGRFWNESLIHNNKIVLSLEVNDETKETNEWIGIVSTMKIFTKKQNSITNENITKEIKAEINTKITENKADIKAEMITNKAEINNKIEEIKAEIITNKAEINTKMTENKADIKAEMVTNNAEINNKMEEIKAEMVTIKTEIMTEMEENKTQMNRKMNAMMDMHKDIKKRSL